MTDVQIQSIDKVSIGNIPIRNGGAHEGRRQWRKQAEVSPVKQEASQVSFANAERRPC